MNPNIPSIEDKEVMQQIFLDKEQEFFDKNYQILYKNKGGSWSYGLNTPTSDLDIRGVFIHKDPSYILGLNKMEHYNNQSFGNDIKFHELRHFFNLLRKANSECIEMLFSDSYLETSKEWDYIKKKRSKLIDTNKLFSCLRGYMQGELRLANGLRTGALGGKRKEAIEKYHFSPKNFVNLFRLSYCGQVYFQEGYFPVNVYQYNKELSEWLLKLKTQPELFNLADLNKKALEMEEKLIRAFENRKINTIFDEDLANDLCFQIYSALIVECKFTRRVIVE